MITKILALFCLLFSLSHCFNLPPCKPLELDLIDAFLIDLDGTLYTPTGLVPGADNFYRWLIDNNKYYALLSNTGCKSPLLLQHKFLTPPFNISSTPIPLSKIFTAPAAIAHFLNDTAPPGSHLYIIQSYSTSGNLTSSCISQLEEGVPPELWGSYDWRTDLNAEDIGFWANRSASEPTFVITCADPDALDVPNGDPVTGLQGYTTWNFTLFSNAVVLVRSGATLIVHAPDYMNAIAPDPSYLNINLDIPGAGAIEKLIQFATFPGSVNRTFCTGKGGNKGKKYMMEYGLKLLESQGFNGNKSRVAMVGDNLYTDIKAAVGAEFLSLFVLSGINSVSDEKYFPKDIPTCTLDSVAQIPLYSSESESAPILAAQK